MSAVKKIPFMETCNDAGDKLAGHEAAMEHKVAVDSTQKSMQFAFVETSFPELPDILSDKP